MYEEKLLNGFFTGVNYWGSRDAINMWDEECFDPTSIEEDFKAMQAAKVTHLRVFPTWHVFQPLKALYTTSLEPYEYRFGENPRPDTPAGRAGVDEAACERFDVFCDLAEQYGLKLVVGLITGHMSFREYAPPAFEGKHRLSDPTVLKWQLRFVKYFVRRFRNKPCIVGWDLGNEVNNVAYGDGFEHKDDFYVWCSAVSDAVRACDPERPVISGFGSIDSVEREAVSLEVVRDTCDVHVCHPYNIFRTASDPCPTMKPTLDLAFQCEMAEGVSGVPTFVQEFGSIGYMNVSQKTEADFYRACLYASLAHGCHGVMWWCAFDQGHLRFAPYDWNNIGSDYGFFDRDRRPKPIAEENRMFHDLLELLPGRELPPHRTDGVILVPRDNGDADADKLRAAYLLGKRAGLDLSFRYALDALPDAPLYLLPSLNSHQPITATRLERLLKKVEDGAVLYISLGTSLFRQLPEIGGISIAWKYNARERHILTMDGTELPVDTPVQFEVESASAEILASTEQGRPVYFVKKHGKGKIFILLAPVEEYLAQRTGAFFLENEPAYEQIYRRLAKASGCVRRVETDSPFVFATEHPVDERKAYIVVVNYSHRPRTVRLAVNGGTLTPVHNVHMENGRLQMRENDGAVFLYTACEEMTGGSMYR